MLRYDLTALTDDTQAVLVSRQADVDAKMGRKAQYDRATVLFKNKTGSAFSEVREKLRIAGPPDGSCYYCERDRFRDIEHVWPKRHYPEKAFAWTNYVYACAVCNQDRKRDTFGIIVAGGKLEVFDRSLDFDQALPVGIPALIDIRKEDPMGFLKLDLETGNFVPIGDAISQARGKFTRDLFDLDDAALARIRRQQVSAYRDYLLRYAQALDVGDKALSDRLHAEINELPHRTVLREMKRQRGEVEWLKPLAAVLEAA